MLVRLAPQERGKMRASVIIYLAVSKLFQITRFESLKKGRQRESSITFPVFTTFSLAQAINFVLSDILGQWNDSSSCLNRNFII